MSLSPDPDSRTKPLPSALAEEAARRQADLQALAENRELAPLAGLNDPVLDTHRVLACSNFVSQICARNPGLLADLIDSGDLQTAYPPDSYRIRVAAALAHVADEDALMAALRRLRQREMVRIAWRDISGMAPLDETLSDTSGIADEIIRATTDTLYGWQCQRFGTPRDRAGGAQPLVVIAMGKLGARELNFSSDIDLIFTFPENGQTSGGERTVTNDQFFIRLGQRLIKALSSATPDGFVYRVDMRLRPFGNSGPLALSFAAMLDYYQAHGRDWERYAFIRARAVTANNPHGRNLLGALLPFTYRKYLDFGAIDSLREMKGLIDGEVNRKGLQEHIKLGPGGIREIEFIGQAFQMIRGGQEPALRGRRIVQVLDQLGTRGYLPLEAVRELSDAYGFLRNTEHRLQEYDDQQTHEIPPDALGRARLAAAMKFPDWDSLHQELSRHRQQVQFHFDGVFALDEGEESTRDSALNGIWSNHGDADHALEVLAEAGFADPATAWDELTKLRGSTTLRALSKTGRRRLDRLVPLLLEAAAGIRESAITLQRLFRLVETIARRSVYLALLAENPVARQHLVRLCAASPWITQQITRYPLLLDELLDPRELYAPPQRAELEADIEERLQRIDPEDREAELDALRQFKQSNVLRIAAADVSNAMPLMVVSDHLTAIAEVALTSIVRLAWRDLVARYGTPRYRVDGTLYTAGFAVVAYGKLGGIELGYGSDLDVVFLHGSTGAGQCTEGPKSVDNGVFFGRLGQRIIHMLSTQTASGVLYEVDSRLRPSGKSGLLVSSIDAFEEYQHESAWTWEHQALVRTRAVAGDQALKTRFEAIRRTVLLRARDPDRLRADVVDMRTRMRDELGSGKQEVFNLKQDAGGIADIEFMVQYGTLRWASELGEYLQYTDNVRLLGGFAAAGLLPEEDTALLADAYRAYRKAVHALALQEREAVAENVEFGPFREGVVEIWRRVMEA